MRVSAQWLCPAALRACPHGFGRGSASSATSPQLWADALRACIEQQDPPIANRTPAPSQGDGVQCLSSYDSAIWMSFLDTGSDG